MDGISSIIVYSRGCQLLRQYQDRLCWQVSVDLSILALKQYHGTNMELIYHLMRLRLILLSMIQVKV